MNKEEYQKFREMPVIDRIVEMNKGTISENLQKLIELSEAEKLYEVTNEKV